MALTAASRETETSSHELATAFEQRGLALSSTLVEMLDEHYSHRTERRGSGFTQATRHLAALVNKPIETQHDRVVSLFPGLRGKLIRSSMVTSDRTGDIPLDSPLRPLLALPSAIEREESGVLAALIRDLVFPVVASSNLEQLPPWPEKLKIGSCPLAEKYFLEIIHRQVRRKGRVNVLISDEGTPLLVEKIGMGDSHSCINVAELLLNGVRLPAGCLFGVAYDEALASRQNSKLPGDIIPIRNCVGFRFLRLTTLAVSPENRARAFSKHFDAQLKAGLYTPGEASIDQLRTVATEQL